MKKLFLRKSLLYRVIFNWPVVILLMLIAGLLITMFAVFYLDFMRIDEIQMEYFDADACQLKIPVRYICRAGNSEYVSAIPFIASNGWRYSFRLNEEADRIRIQICRLGFGGLAAYEARYEITDPAIHARLLEMVRKHQPEQ